jgi:hypothetical protein
MAVSVASFFQLSGLMSQCKKMVHAKNVSVRETTPGKLLLFNIEN